MGTSINKSELKLVHLQLGISLLIAINENWSFPNVLNVKRPSFIHLDNSLIIRITHGLNIMVQKVYYSRKEADLAKQEIIILQGSVHNKGKGNSV